MGQCGDCFKSVHEWNDKMFSNTVVLVCIAVFAFEGCVLDQIDQENYSTTDTIPYNGIVDSDSDYNIHNWNGSHQPYYPAGNWTTSGLSPDPPSNWNRSSMPPDPPSNLNSSVLPPDPPSNWNSSGLSPDPPGNWNSSVLSPDPPSNWNSLSMPPDPPSNGNSSSMPLDPPSNGNSSSMPLDPSSNWNSSSMPPDPPSNWNSSVLPPDPSSNWNSSSMPSDPPSNWNSSGLSPDPPGNWNSSVLSPDPPSNWNSSSMPPDPPSNGNSSSMPPDPPSNGNSSSITPDPPGNLNSSSMPPNPPSNWNSSSMPPDPPSNWNSSSMPPDPPSNWNSSCMPLDPPSNGNSSSMPPDPPSNWNSSSMSPDPPSYWNSSVLSPDPPSNWNSSAQQPGSLGYDYYYYNHNDGIVLNTTDVEMFLNKPETLEYLNRFSNLEQKMVIIQTLRHCPYTSLCNFSFGITVPMSQWEPSDPCCFSCSCRPNCVKEGRCCPDYPGFQLDVPLQSPVTSVVETCMETYIRHQRFDGRSYVVKAYQRCPESTNPELQFRCSGELNPASDVTIDDILPLYDNNTLKTYRNKHCALCNGADVDTLISWDVRFGCYERPTFTATSNLLSIVLNGTMWCEIQLLKPQYAMVEECDVSINQCNGTGLWREFNFNVYKACLGYGMPFFTLHQNFYLQFKNLFCAMCNGIEPTTYLCEFESSGHSGPYPFSGLLRLESIDDQEAGLGKESCGPGEMFDDIQSRCRNVPCPYHRVLKNDHCELLIKSSANIVYSVTSIVQLPTGRDVHELFKSMPVLKSRIDNVINSLDIGACCNKQTIITLKNNTIGSNASLVVDSIHFRHDIVPDYILNIDDTVQKLLTVNRHNVTTMADNVTFTIHLKDESRYYNIVQFPYDRYSNWTFWEEKQVSLNELISLAVSEDGFLWVPYFHWNEYGSNCDSHGALHRLLDLLPCPMFSINMTAFGIIDTPGGIKFVGQDGIVIGPTEYVMDEETCGVIRLCVDTYRRVFRGHEETGGITAEDIVSLLSVSVSIACLLISLFTYCWIPQLQTLPGKNNIALIVSLLLAQSLYLFSSYGSLDTESLSCKLIGGFTHFFWLLSVFWMNVCTFHMFRVLLTVRATSISSSKKKHIRYHIYSILASAVFVTVNIVVTMVHSEYTDFGYGNGRCYISTQRMVEVTFGIPAAVVVLANLSMFLAIIIHLKRAPSVSKNVKHERNYSIVFAKLSTITGTTWTFGFVYMWTGIAAFSYLFIVLNGSQGVFLMISFVCNGRTFARFKERGHAVWTQIVHTDSFSLTHSAHSTTHS